MNRRQPAIDHINLFSVIINDLNVKRIAVLEAKADSPLVIDADAMLPEAIMLERLQVIRRWQAQILKARSRIQLCEPHGGASKNISWNAPRSARCVEALRLDIRK
jgi:hypothetical protein